MRNAAFRKKPWLIGGNGIDAKILVDQAPRVGLLRKKRERINTGRLGEIGVDPCCSLSHTSTMMFT
jgi:hypothetical protein